MRRCKITGISRTVWFTQFSLCGRGFFCPPPSLPNNIVSFFYLSWSLNFDIFFLYQSTTWSQDFFGCMILQKPYYFNVYFRFLIFWPKLHKFSFNQKFIIFSKYNFTTKQFLDLYWKPTASKTISTDIRLQPCILI